MQFQRFQWLQIFSRLKTTYVSPADSPHYRPYKRYKIYLCVCQGSLAPISHLLSLAAIPGGDKHGHDLASGVQCARSIKSAGDNLSLTGFLGCELTLNRIKSNWVMTRRLCSPGETCLDESPRAGCGLFCLLGSGTPSPPLSATSTPSVNQTVIINGHYESPLF